MAEDLLDRKPRAQQTREAEPIHEEYQTWDDSLLSTKHIPARDGYSQRWVRTTIKGDQDQTNLQRKFNQGWRPRALSTVPKGQFVMNIDFQGQDVVGIQGMILMEIPTKLLDRHKEEVRNNTDMQMQSVKQNYLNARDPNDRGNARMQFEENSKASRGRIASIDD